MAYRRTYARKRPVRRFRRRLPYRSSRIARFRRNRRGRTSRYGGFSIIKSKRSEYFRSTDVHITATLALDSTSVTKNILTSLSNFERAVEISKGFRQFRVRRCKLVLTPNQQPASWAGMNDQFKFGEGLNVITWINTDEYYPQDPVLTYEGALRQPYARMHSPLKPIIRYVKPYFRTERSFMKEDGTKETVLVSTRGWMSTRIRDVSFGLIGIRTPSVVLTPPASVSPSLSVRWECEFEFKGRLGPNQ